MGLVTSEREALGLDHMPVSLQRLELALISRFESFGDLAGSPGDLAEVREYIARVMCEYSGCTPARPGQPARHLSCGPEELDLDHLLHQVFTQLTGMVLFRAAYARLTCLPA